MPKGKGKKVAKDPNAPKRPLSSYMCFVKENRPRIAKPGMSVAEVSKAAGAEWKNIADKSKWEKQAVADKLRYEKEMEAYNKGK